MSTTVTKLPGNAENLTIGVTGASNWTGLSNAISNDNLFATNDFNSGAGSGKSNYLYLNDFDFDISDAAVIEGIVVTVERKGVGTIEDYYVGLIYPDGGEVEITSPGAQSATTWPAASTETTYGGVTETWNRTWTPTEINDDDFGFGIAIEGDPDNLDAGFIDYVSMSLYYHQEINNSGSGGGAVGGEAALTMINNSTTPTGGVVVSGQGFIIINETTSGGAIVGGTSTLDTEVSAFGGVVAGSTASLEYTSVHSVTGGVISSGSADVFVRKDHVPEGAVILSGSPTLLFSFNPDTSAGVAAGGSTDAFIYIFVSGGARPGGEATWVPVYGPVISGGAKANGEAAEDSIFNLDSSGGAISGGAGSPGIQPAISGGATLAGEATWSFYAIPAASGGAVVSPDHNKTQTYNSQPDFGGASLGTRARVERLRYFETVRRGYGRAMVSENILTEEIDTTTKIMDPFMETTPTLNSGAFLHDHDQGWRDPNEESDYPVLPNIVRNRQREILPPKVPVTD